MQRSYKFFAAVIMVGSATLLTSSARAQQWGPPAQSSHYHKPNAPDVLTAYNTSVQRPAAQPSAAPAARPQTTRPTAPTAAAHRAATARPRTVSAQRLVTPIRLGQ